MRLIRVAYADLALGKIDRGDIIEIQEEYITDLVASFKKEQAAKKDKK